MKLRLTLALLCAIGQLLAIVPEASAQTVRLSAKWTPGTLGATELAGKCPTPTNAGAACQIVRGATYKASATFALDAASEPLLIDVQGGGLDIQAVSKATGADFTRKLAANQSETVDVTVTVPEANGRRDRSFYIGHVTLSGGSGRVVGSLTISLTVPAPRVTWGRLTDTKGETAPITAIIGSGATITRNVNLTSNLDITDFGVNTNTDRVTLTGVPSTLAAGDTTQVTLTYKAPIVNRRTASDVILRPAIGGIQALEKALRVRIVVLPVELSWSPPTVRGSLIVQRQQPVPQTVTVTSNYDVGGVHFRTADLGLNPVVSPLNPVDLKAGVPQTVQLRMCPGYAPTTYFIGITAYQGNKPLNKKLYVRMKVEDDGTGLPAPGGADPCAA